MLLDQSEKDEVSLRVLANEAVKFAFPRLLYHEFAQKTLKFSVNRADSVCDGLLVPLPLNERVTLLDDVPGERVATGLPVCYCLTVFHWRLDRSPINIPPRCGGTPSPVMTGWHPRYTHRLGLREKPRGFCQSSTRAKAEGTQAGKQ